MKLIIIREPVLADMPLFLEATKRSESLHHPWVKAPTTPTEFHDYIERYNQSNHKSYLVISENNIVGVFNISEIIRGLFQNGYLGFYGMLDYLNKGYMSTGLKLVLGKAFADLGLHRLEANIQPENINSINLIKANGFTKEGYSPRYLKINDVWRDHERWALTYEDWQKLSGM